MQLNHFADPFQNGQASVDQFFSESNNLTEQYNPGYDPGVGFGYTQNTAGYEWGNDEAGNHGGAIAGHRDSHDRMPPMAATGCATGNCGGDPAALARANLEWEHQQSGGGAAPRKAKEDDEPLEITDYLYHIGPDALDFDPETEAPQSGMAYWKKRLPTILINLVAILAWMWIWSHFGLSALLPGTVATIVYWGFVAVMAIGAFQSDHRAARYEEEREQLNAVDSNLRMIVALIGGSVALLLGFKLLDGRNQTTKQAVYISLAIGFFASLIGVMSFSAKKRGESVRRYRKIKSAILNISVALIAVAAMLTFDVGTSLSGAKQSGGASGAAGATQEPQRVIHVVRPMSKGRKGSSKNSKNTKIAAPVEVEYVQDAAPVKKVIHLQPEPVVQHEYAAAPTYQQPSYNPPPVVAPTVLQPQHPVQQPQQGPPYPPQQQNYY